MRKRLVVALLAMLLLFTQGAFADAPLNIDALAALYDEAVDFYIQEGQYGDALTALISMGSYDNEKVAAYYFKIAEKYLEENKMAELSAMFPRAAACPHAETDFLEPLYQKAVSLCASGPHMKAFQLFRLLGDYKDSAARADAAYAAVYATPAATATPAPAAPAPAAPVTQAVSTPKPAASGLNGAQVGDMITFGAYEQDNNKSNGKEPIQWRVLAKENGRLLVISQYGIECRRFSENYKGVWNRSTLRTWLNEDFLSAAFSADEQARLFPFSITTPPHAHNKGKEVSTQDRVFLLSAEEAREYFRSDADRQCKATASAKKQGATIVDGGYCWWWLRTSGNSDYTVVKVFTTGEIDQSGYSTNSTRGCVRPALWIQVEP